MEREIKEIRTECNCGCMEMKIQKSEVFTEAEIKEFNKNEDERYEYILDFHESKFYSKQVSILRTIGRRIKLAWFMLIGKEYLFEEMILTEKQVKELTEKLQEIVK